MRHKYAYAGVVAHLALRIFCIARHTPKHVTKWTAKAQFSNLLPIWKHTRFISMQNVRLKNGGEVGDMFCTPFEICDIGKHL